MTKNEPFDIFLDDLRQLPVINRDTLTTLQKQTQSQPAVLQEIFASFFEDARELTENMEAAVANQDEKSYTEFLHTLKGLAGTIGASRLHELSNYLYIQARNNDLSDASKGLPLINSCLRDLEKDLDGLI